MRRWPSCWRRCCSCCPAVRPRPGSWTAWLWCGCWGWDGGEEVTLTAVCGGTDQGDVSRGAASAADFQSARQALPWVGEEELALTNISYIIVGAEADLSEALGLILSDHEMSPSATVWLTQDAGALLDACEDPGGPAGSVGGTGSGGPHSGDGTGPP